MAKAKTETTTTMHPRLKTLIDEGIPLEYVICKDTVRSKGVPERAFYSPDTKKSPTSVKTRLARLYLTHAGIVIHADGFLTMTSLSNAVDYKPL